MYIIGIWEEYGRALMPPINICLLMPIGQIASSPLCECQNISIGLIRHIRQVMTGPVINYNIQETALYS